MPKKLSLALIMCIMVFTYVSEAAYIAPKKQKRPDTHHQSQPVVLAIQSNHLNTNPLAEIELSQSRLIKPGVNPDDRYSSTAEGVFSIVCAAFSVASFIALSITSSQFFIIPALIFGIGAFVFGAIGINRHKKGYAIAGMVLGLIQIIASFAVMADLPRL